MKKFIIAGNWKMNVPDLEGYVKLFAELKPSRDVIRAVFPPYPYIRPLQSLADNNQFYVGAQDVSEYVNGAYTGEVSAPMLAAVGARLVIVGHSERRARHGETDEIVLAKTRAALAEGLIAIVCCGETLAERESGRAVEVVTRQIGAVFGSLSDAERESCVAAYEPVWAIGTGKTATPEEADAMCAEINKIARCPVLYGGSVSLANAEAILSQAHIDGALIGGASLDADAFTRIIALAAELSAKL
jgi:triosephosphate isomerase